MSQATESYKFTAQGAAVVRQDEKCNRTACQVPIQPNAAFWNGSTLAFYCKDCARKINECNPGLCIPATLPEWFTVKNYIAETDWIRASVALQGAKDIIAAAPWVQGEGELPHRVVLRDDGAAYVVHVQTTSKAYFGEPKPACFEHGSYFPYHGPHAPCCPPSGVMFRQAWKRFEERSRLHLGLKE